MSNVARKYYQSVQPKYEPKTKVKKVRVHAKITLGEKILYFTTLAFLFFISIQIISYQSKIYEVNKEIEDIKTAIQQQETVNHDLEVQISDLSKYDRIGQKAKELGLEFDANNVRAVEVR